MIITQNTNLSQEEERQYFTAKNIVAWRDCSAIGKLLAIGDDTIDFLHRISTNAVQSLKKGQGIQTALLTEKARIVDVLTILNDENRTFILTSENSAETIVNWLDKYAVMDDVVIENCTETFGSIQIFGVRSGDFIEELTGANVRDISISNFKKLMVLGSEILVVRTQRMCELSFMLIFPKEIQENFFDLLRSLSENLPEVSEKVFEILRIESGIGKYGAEWTEKHNLLEAGLLGIVNFKKGCYIGQEVISRLDTYQKVKCHLVGLQSESAIPLGSAIIENNDGDFFITSSAFSPALEKFIALGFVPTIYASASTNISLQFADEILTVEIVNLPFVV